MHTLSKNIVIIVVFSLLSLLAIGCGEWEGGKIVSLKVDTPKEGETVTTPQVTVSGHVGGTKKEKALVKINENNVPLQDGKFSTSITLTEGKNTINILADVGEDKDNKQVTITYTPGK